MIRKTSIFFLLMMTVVVADAGATTVLKMDLPTLCAKSQRIVIGQVKSVESRFEKNGSAIFTYAEFSVEQTLKGEPVDSLTLRIPGGAIGEKTMTVFGAPFFKQGQHLFLILAKDPGHDSAFRVMGFHQGRYTIFQQGDADFAVQDSGREPSIFAGCGEDKVACVKDKGLTVLPMNELVAEVKKHLIEAE